MEVTIDGHPIQIDAERITRDVSNKLEAYLNGERVTFNEPVDLSDHTAFQQDVLRLLQNIPYGTTMQYQQIARRIGRNDAARAVANVCGSNPCPIIIPCHRVVAQDGIGGYRAGKDAKRALLELEGIDIDSF